MKVLILGASGIIGQHMRLCVPAGIEPVFARRAADLLHVGADLADVDQFIDLLDTQRPDVILNLAGESRPDVVEQDPRAAELLNMRLPGELARWADEHGAHLVHASSQAVFDGEQPPYWPESPRKAVNIYGLQKVAAEDRVGHFRNWTIARPTFVLGVRPLPHVGRPNPVEQMLSGQRRQVRDRWFSPLFARDAASLLWGLVLDRRGGIVHLGTPVRVSRYDIAARLGCETEPANHEDFPGLAPRPRDTTYAQGSRWLAGLDEGLAQCRRDWQAKAALEAAERAREIALFLGMNEQRAGERLAKGFVWQHAAVAADFRRAAPASDAALLDWYRQTESYIWELSAYHCDPGFNYSGCCRGICERLRAAGARRVLCLGDGIGDLTLTLRAAGIGAIYHDLAGSRTAAFAEFRAWMRTGHTMPMLLTGGWAPEIRNGQPYDAVVSLDYLEHVTDVACWSRAIREALVPGGLFCAVNAFACGSGEHGSIPMHLARNDRYEKEWDPLMASLGMRQQSSNWYQTPC